MTPLPPIRFDCPACGRPLRAAAGLAGRPTHCPECGQPLTVPPASAAGGGVSDTSPQMPVLPPAE